MTVTIDAGQLLELTTQIILTIGGVYSLWRFLKRHWDRPPSS